MTNPTKEDKRKKPYEAQSYSAGMKQGKKEALETADSLSTTLMSEVPRKIIEAIMKGEDLKKKKESQKLNKSWRKPKMTNPTKEIKHEIEYHFTSKAFKEHNKEMRDEGKKEFLKSELYFLEELQSTNLILDNTIKISNMIANRILQIGKELEKLK
jgi:hypothetical protein